jgi:mitochondrial fission protein ELM1
MRESLLAAFTEQQLDVVNATAAILGFEERGVRVQTTLSRNHPGHVKVQLQKGTRRSATLAIPSGRTRSDLFDILAALAESIEVPV